MPHIPTPPILETIVSPDIPYTSDRRPHLIILEAKAEPSYSKYDPHMKPIGAPTTTDRLSRHTLHILEAKAKPSYSNMPDTPYSQYTKYIDPTSNTPYTSTTVDPNIISTEMPNTPYSQYTKYIDPTYNNPTSPTHPTHIRSEGEALVF